MTVHRLAVFLAIALAFWLARAAHAQSDAGWDKDNPAASLEFTIESRGSAQWRDLNGPVSLEINRTVSGELTLRGAYASADLVAQTQSPSAAVEAATPGPGEVEIVRQIRACGRDSACAQRLAMQLLAMRQQRIQAAGNSLRYIIWSPSSVKDNGCVVRWSESVDDRKTDTERNVVAGTGVVLTQRITTWRHASQRPSVPVCGAPPLATAVGDSSWTVGFAGLGGVAKTDITIRGVTTRTERSDWIPLSALVHPEAMVIRGTGVPAGMVTLQGIVMYEEQRRIPVEVRITWAVKNIAEVQADPGGPYRITRGDPEKLDGSGSRGAGLRYEWSFAPRGCPPGVEINREARLSGVRPQVTLLCTTEVTLTVTDGHKSDSKSVTVEVVPREWKRKTSFEHLAEEGRLDAAAPFVRRTSRAGEELSYVVSFEGGQNVSATDPSRDANQTLEPFAVNGTWDGLGYTLEQISDGGPFHRVWYVRQYDMSVKRKTLINKFIIPNGASMRIGSFYAENKRLETKIDEWLTALRAHEGLSDQHGVLGHSGLIEKALREHDPAVRVEAVLSRDRAALVQEVDDVLRETDAYLCRQSKDPLPQIWSGPVALPFDDSSGWEIVTMTTGGRNYGTPGCR